jgi:hypothetical protein
MSKKTHDHYKTGKAGEATAPAAAPEAGASEAAVSAGTAAPTTSHVAPAPPETITLDELREAGYLLAEGKPVDGKTTVITRGGRRLVFPGDEETAATLSHSDLTGEPALNPAEAAAVLPPRSLEDLRALRCVVDGKEVPVILADATDTEEGITRVVTRGGRTLTFPGDEAKAGRMTSEQLDGISRKGFPRAGLFKPKG